MTESSMPMDEPVAGSETWAGRFLVRAEVDHRDRRGKTTISHMIHFQPDMSTEEVAALLQPLGYPPDTENYRYLASQAKDTFSQAQAEKLVAYLNKRKGTRAYMKPANKPVPEMMGASAIPSLPSIRDRSVYKLHLEPGYHLGFKVEAVNMKIFISMAYLFKEFREQDGK
jgi:hypothetical protein